MKPQPSDAAREFFETYTRGLTADEFQQLFTRDARDAYRVLSRGLDAAALADLPWHRRLFIRLRLFFFAFTMKLSPPRARALRDRAGLAQATKLCSAPGFLDRPSP